MSGTGPYSYGTKSERREERGEERKGEGGKEWGVGERGQKDSISK